MEQRAAIIAEGFPRLDSDKVATLAKHTSGLWGTGLLGAVTNYVDAGELPGYLYRRGMCPIDPVQGYYIEYLMDPYELAGQLRSAGFKITLRAYLGGARGGPVALVNDLLTWRPLTPFAMRFARAFRILATKA